MAATVFPLFSSLPAELRDQIWQHALPDRVSQALCVYKKGCWVLRPFTQPELDYDTENGRFTWNYAFDHNSLDSVQVELPLFFVNREARRISLNWADDQNLQMQFHKDIQSLVFVRLFDPVYDTLYIPLNKFDEFIREPFDRQTEIGLIEQSTRCLSSAVTRIAIPKALLLCEVDPLPEILDWYCRLEKLFVVVNMQSDLPEDNEREVQQRWELNSIQEESLLWNLSTGSFESGDTKHIGDEALHKLIERACSDGLVDKLTDHQMRSFEIRPGLAVKLPQQRIQGGFCHY